MGGTVGCREGCRLGILNMKTVFQLFFLSGVFLLGGCSFETVYIHIQQDNGWMMKAPIKFTVRVAVNREKKEISWLQDVKDANGLSDFQIITFGESKDSTCEIFDNENWKCELKAFGQTLQIPEMKDGNLSRFYFGKIEDYKEGYRVLGRTI